MKNIITLILFAITLYSGANAFISPNIKDMVLMLIFGLMCYSSMKIGGGKNESI